MKVIKLVGGNIAENCYLIGNSSCYIIDPGFNFGNIVKAIESNFSKVKAILLTHGHFDHVGVVDSLVKKYNCQVYLNDFDKDFIDGKHIHLLNMGSAVVTLQAHTIDTSKLKDENIKVLKTPGHSAGSVCYIFENEKIMFSGDTLLKSDVGRTDFYSSDPNQLKNSLKLLKALDVNYKIYPGHREETMLNIEKAYNPYLLKIE